MGCEAPGTGDEVHVRGRSAVMGVQGDAFDAILKIRDALEAADYEIDETQEWIPATRDVVLELIKSSKGIKIDVVDGEPGDWDY